MQERRVQGLPEYKLVEKEFILFRDLIYDIAGIALSQSKHGLLLNRLGRRLAEYQLESFSEYYSLVVDPKNQEELQTMVDLITTNETYFFREEKHFEFLANNILDQWRPETPFRIWSAACSTGEEVYSLAMVMAERLGLHSPWSIQATDINVTVLAKAEQALYPLEASKKIPGHLLRQYCLKGTHQGKPCMLMEQKLRDHVSFQHLNLLENWPEYEKFDLILLRNVMIYFDASVKTSILSRMANTIKLDGHLFIGHSESLLGLEERFRMLRPSIYRRIG